VFVSDWFLAIQSGLGERKKGDGQLSSEFEGRLPFVSFGSFCELVEEMASFFVCHRGEESKKGKGEVVDEVNDQKEGVSHHRAFWLWTLLVGLRCKKL
jgi:hypothetical protein